MTGFSPFERKSIWRELKDARKKKS
ncbi:MAG: hypothetical protein UZ07_CHB004000717, partial [Chlorobi bacterium OLB7]